MKTTISGHLKLSTFSHFVRMISCYHGNFDVFNDKYFKLRWLNIVFKKMENSRFTCVFLVNYYLLINKKYTTYIKKLKR